MIPEPMNVVAIEKRSSVAFVDAVISCWSRGEVAFPLELNAEVPEGISVERYVSCSPGGGWIQPVLPICHGDRAAQITLTSGTTGRPKPILLTHRSLGDVTGRLIKAQALDSTVREYIGVPVTFSFGLGRVRAVAAVGGSCFLPERGFRVDELARMLRRGEINALSAVPTLLRVALAERERLVEVGAKLRWLEIGSQSMSADEKAAVRTLFPNAVIIQHYGLTEASRTTFLDVSCADEAALGSVGRASADVDVRITDSGLIAIRGPHVAKGIIYPGGTLPIIDEGGWLVTQDLGRIDANGNLHFVGRADHLINVGGIKVSAELFEERLISALGRAAPIAVSAGHDPLRGEVVVVAYEGEEDPDYAAAATAVAAEFGIGEGLALLHVSAIPRTATDKVRRQDITGLFSKREIETTSPVPSLSSIAVDDAGDGVVACFVAMFGDAGREESASFHELGGDSLHYVSLLTGLERYISDLPEDWDSLSIGALRTLATEQAAAGAPSEAPRRELPRGLDSIRGFACVLIVALHVVGATAEEGLRLPATSAWHDIMASLHLVRLPLFTAIAGYLYGAMPAFRSGFSEFISRKARQLFIPMVFATLVFWSLRNIVHPNEESLALAYLNGYQHLWYINALLLIFFAVAFIDTVLSPKMRLKALITLTILALAVYYVMPDVPIFQIKNAMFLLPFFVLGVVLFRVPAILHSRGLVTAAAIIAVCLLVGQQVGEGPNGIIGQLPWLRWVGGSATVLVLLKIFPKTVILEKIAAYSFTIYLWHPAANGAVRAALMKIGFAQVWLLFAVGLAVGVVFPIALHLAASRMPKILRLPIIGR